MVSVKKWRALHTRKGSEKSVCERLQKINLDCYCPFIQRSKNKIKVQKRTGAICPLLPEYVFVKCAEEDYKTIEAIPDVYNFFYWLGRKVEVDENEIKSLKEAMQSGNDYLPERYNDEKSNHNLIMDTLYYSSTEIRSEKKDGEINLPSLRLKLVKKSGGLTEDENIREEKMYAKYYSWL